MSRKDEDRILHGLHYFRETLDEEFTVTCDQVLWLAAHAYADGGSWYKDGDLQNFDCSVIPTELRKKLLIASGGKNYIETVWGRGYVMRLASDEQAAA